MRDPKYRGLYQYPFPLAGGRFAYLHLPPDLSKADAERLCDAVRALALNDTDNGEDVSDAG